MKWDAIQRRRHIHCGTMNYPQFYGRQPSTMPRPMAKTLHAHGLSDIAFEHTDLQVNRATVVPQSHVVTVRRGRWSSNTSHYHNITKWETTYSRPWLLSIPTPSGQTILAPLYSPLHQQAGLLRPQRNHPNQTTRQHVYSKMEVSAALRHGTLGVFASAEHAVCLAMGSVT